MKMTNDKLNILFPGSFKPVHAGHMNYIKKYLEDYEGAPTNLYVIIARKNRDGISANTSCDFLNKVFGSFPNFHCVVADCDSPVTSAYNMAATKKFGDGRYALASSTKDTDERRSNDFVKYFSENGKYYTPGIRAEKLNALNVPLFKNRNDDFDDTPISARVLRNDIFNDDYKKFSSSYDGVDEETLHKYYEKLLDEIKQGVHETAVAGRINHVYDDTSTTFGEIKNMVSAIFNGEITDVTEKIDGINILASVDELGRTIFARNKNNLFTSPMLLDDILQSQSWNEQTKKSFIEGATAINKVFDNIKDKIRFFNYDDKADGVKYRTWYSVEIFDTNNKNVVPYIDNFISFHHNAITACTKYYPKDDFSESTFTNPNMETDMNTLQNAINAAKKSDLKVNVQITPSLIFKNNSEAGTMLHSHLDSIIELMEEYNLSDDNTIADYMHHSIKRQLYNNKKLKLPADAIDLLAERWSGVRKVKMSDFLKESRKMAKSVENEYKDKIKDRAMLPINRIFINIGNDISKLYSGWKNSARQDESIKKIREELKSALNDIQKEGDEKKLVKLERILLKFGEKIDVNAYEGIVFKYGGRFYKITGSFPVLNQILHMRNK